MNRNKLIISILIICIITLGVMSFVVFQPKKDTVSVGNPIDNNAGSDKETALSTHKNTHFAEINNKGEVIRVVVATQDFIDSGALGDPKNWKPTNKYTRDTVKGYNYAAKGNFYNESLQDFLPKKPSDDAYLNTTERVWELPEKNVTASST